MGDKMENKIVITVVGVVVSVLLICSLMIPVVNDDVNYRQGKSITYTNEGIPLAEGNLSSMYTFNAQYGDVEIENIFTLGATSWILSSDGKLFGCGRNNYGQQGDGTTTDVTTFTQRLAGERIVDVACSISTTWAITEDGKLFGCGKNNFNQQGDGTTTDVTTFTQRLAGERIVDVSTSDYATFGITMDGKLFGCGRNDYGQQGDGTTTDVTTFTQRSIVGSLRSFYTNVNGVTSSVDVFESDYTWLAGGLDWMLCAVQDRIILYYAGLTQPLIWDEDVTFYFDEGSVSIDNNGTTYTMNYTSIYYRGNGQYVLTDGSAYVNESTSLIGYSIPTSDSAVEVSYTSDSINAIKIADGSIVLGDGYVQSEDTEHEGLSIITELGVTYDSNSTSVCDSVIAPKNVTITGSVVNNTLKDIVSIVPVLLIAGLILTVSGLYVYRRL